jgi:hypothetical protein
MSFTAHPRAMMAALGPPRFALLPLGCHHGPWAGRKTHDPSGGGSVMYHYLTLKSNSVSHTDQFDVPHDPIEPLKGNSVSHT